MIPPELLPILQAAGTGVIPLLGYMWWTEKRRADEEREKNETLARESITAMVKFEATIGTLSAILSAPGRTGP